jgi:hypothetical protein
MSATRTQSTPAVVRPQSLDRASHRSFLADVVIEHGPRDLMRRLFLVADTGLRERGLYVSFGDCEELKVINAQNRDSWSPLLPIFDPVVSDVGEANCVAIVGRNASGKPVLAHASRCYDLGETLLKDEIESLRLFYREPEKSALSGEALVCSAPVAARTRGRVVFTGALWVHPEFRGQNLVPLAMNLWRGLAITRWTHELSFSFMVPKLVKVGLAARAAMQVDWEVTMINTPVKRGGIINAGMNWITRSQQIEHMRAYVDAASGASDAQVDGRVLEGSGQKKVAG